MYTVPIAMIFVDIHVLFLFKIGEKCETLPETITTKYTDYNVS